jgi:hypothetical protein
MFRVLNYMGATPREISEVVNNLMNGKSNNTGTITLNTGNATTTSLVDERISVDTKIVLIPFSDAAEVDSAPYGAFQDSTDQAATTLSDAYIMSFDTTDLSNGVYLSNSNRINVRNTGTYAVQYSVQAKNTTNDTQNLNIWLRKNGTDITGSNSRFGMPPRKSSGDPSHVIAVTTFFLDLAANDYVQVAWHPSDLGVSLEHYAAVSAVAGTTPAIPATPSVIVTVQYIAPMAYSNIYVSSQQAGQATITHFANSTASKTYAYILVG